MTVLPKVIYKFSEISYQITNGIFHRTKTKNFWVGVKTQRILSSQINLEKEKQIEESGSLAPDYTTKPRLSIQYGTDTKPNIDQWNRL